MQYNEDEIPPKRGKPIRRLRRRDDEVNFIPNGKVRAANAKEKAERLAAKRRELGIAPAQI